VRNANFETLLHSVACALLACVIRPAVVHVHGIGPALVTPLLRLFGLRVVVTHHGPDYDREKWGRAARAVLNFGEAMGMLFANRSIAVSRGIGDLVRKKYGIPCEVIPNGVVVLDLPSATDRVAALGLEPGRYVLTVGRLVPEKRQIDVVRAFAAVRPPGWRLAIVGQADHGNAYAERLKAEAAQTEGVVMAGFRGGEDLRQLYAHAGLYVLASSHEGLPIALLEALSYGVPMLVSDIPANREVVDDDPSLLFRLGDVAGLGEKILAHVADGRVDSDRERTRRESVSRYDWDVIARKVDTVYDEVSGRGIRSATSG
jgi:glycosyltransferase involved in cell wall biosynthesis